MKIEVVETIGKVRKTIIDALARANLTITC